DRRAKASPALRATSIRAAQTSELRAPTVRSTQVSKDMSAAAMAAAHRETPAAVRPMVILPEMMTTAAAVAAAMAATEAPVVSDGTADVHQAVRAAEASRRV